MGSRRPFPGLGASPPKLHSEESICYRSHLQWFERTGNDLDFIAANGSKNGFKIFLCINQRIGGPQLREEMGIRIADQGESHGSAHLYSPLVKVDHRGIEMAIFERIEEIQVLHQVSV